MNPVLHEMRRALTSKSVIILLVVLISLVGVLTYAFSAFGTQTTASGLQVQDNAVLLNATGNYTVVNYITNAYVAPIQGYQIQLNATEYSDNRSSNLFEANLTTSASGYANYTFSHSKVNSSSTGPQVDISIMSNNPGQQGIYLAFLALYDQLNAKDPFQYTLSLISDPGHPTSSGFLLSYRSINSGSSPAVNLFLDKQPQSYSGINPGLKNATFLGTYSGFSNVAVYPSVNTSDFYQVLVYNHNNTTSLYNGSFVATFNSGSPVGTYESIVLVLVSTITGYILILAAIFVGYFIYGKDRALGVADSVLAMPISRKGLILSRYVSGSLTMLVLSAASMGLAALLIHVLQGASIPLQFVAILILGLTSTAMSFLGLMYLFSHLTKSTGALIGVSIFLFLLFTIAWSMLAVFVPMILGFTPGSAGYNQMYVVLIFMNPTSITTVATEVYYSSISTTGILSPSMYGINVYSLSAMILLWVLVPIVLAFYLAIKRD